MFTSRFRPGGQVPHFISLSVSPCTSAAGLEVVVGQLVGNFRKQGNPTTVRETERVRERERGGVRERRVRERERGGVRERREMMREGERERKVERQGE